MVEAKTLAQVADEIGIPANTIKTWLHQFENIGAAKDPAGRWRFTPEAEDVLRQIHTLRLDGRTMDTVRRRLDDDSTADEQPQSEQAPEPGSVTDEPRSTAPASLDTDELAAIVTASVVQAIQAQSEQAERYARATYRVGELEATVRAVEADRDRLASELADARRVIAQLEAPKAAAPARPWWRVW